MGGKAARGLLVFPREYLVFAHVDHRRDPIYCDVEARTSTDSALRRHDGEALEVVGGCDRVRAEAHRLTAFVMRMYAKSDSIMIPESPTEANALAEVHCRDGFGSSPSRLVTVFLPRVAKNLQ